MTDDGDANGVREAMVRQEQIYRERLLAHGLTHKALHWSSEAAQAARFQAFLAAGPFEGRRILDIGSGLGDFYAFLAARYADLDLTGYDVVPEFVEEARRRHPAASFECRDVLSAPPATTFHIVFCSGVFAFGNRALFDALLRRAWELCSEAMALNFHWGKLPGFFLLPRSELLAACDALGPARVDLVEGYAPRDLTVVLRRPAGPPAWEAEAARASPVLP